MKANCLARKGLSSKGAALLALFFLVSALLACSYKPFSKVENSPTPSPAVNAPNESNPESKTTLPKPSGFVNDFAGVLDPESKARLETALTELKDKSAIEFAVVTIETTGDQPIFDYSLALAREWGVGPKDDTKGGGLLLMLAVKDRQWWIQVSNSLENELPDEVCKELGEEALPLYREGKYSEGLTKYVKSIVQRLEKLNGFKLNSEL